MLVVLDNVLDAAHQAAVVDYFASNAEARAMKWHKWCLSEAQADESPMARLVQQAARFFDLSAMVGCEYWSHYGTRPQWHIDKDEDLNGATGEISCPLCSIVYYGRVNATGGAFVTESVSIQPINNRMIVFAPGIFHGVEPYTGERLSVAVNPWARKPGGYGDEKG